MPIIKAQAVMANSIAVRTYVSQAVLRYQEPWLRCRMQFTTCDGRHTTGFAEDRRPTTTTGVAKDQRPMTKDGFTAPSAAC